MNLAQRDIGNVTVLDLSGKLTVTDGAGRLKEKVTSLVQDGRKQIVLNLAKLTYLDSAGLGEMVACYTTATKSGGLVKISHATAKINDLLTITKLLTVFDAHETEAGAVALRAAGLTTLDCRAGEPPILLAAQPHCAIEVQRVLSGRANARYSPLYAPPLTATTMNCLPPAE
jgi:anti-sigma B factor antagonist